MTQMSNPTYESSGLWRYSQSVFGHHRISNTLIVEITLLDAVRNLIAEKERGRIGSVSPILPHFYAAGASALCFHEASHLLYRSIVRR